jgi:hypothetical protein
MFLESRFGSRKPVLRILSSILEDIFGDLFEKKKRRVLKFFAAGQ